MTKKSSVQSYQDDLHFEIWGKYYKLKLNEDKRYDLYRIHNDNRRSKFNVTFETDTHALEEARKYVLNHDMAFKKSGATEKQKTKAGIKITNALILLGLIVFSVLAVLAISIFL